MGVLKIGPKRAPNILVLNPGTSASAAYFAPLAQDVVSKAKGWQVWAVERRENLLEDHSVLDRGKRGTATPREVFDYYLGWITDCSITNHFQLIPDADVAFAKRWGMRVEIEDLRRVVKQAERAGRRCASWPVRRTTWHEGRREPLDPRSGLPRRRLLPARRAWMASAIVRQASRP